MARRRREAVGLADGCTNSAYVAERLYSYAWGNNARRRALQGRRCRILARGRMNTVLIEFLDNGERVTTSTRALRRIDGAEAGNK